MEKLKEKIRDEIKEKIKEKITWDLLSEVKNIEEVKSLLVNPKNIKIVVCKNSIILKTGFFMEFHLKYFRILWEYFPHKESSLKIPYEEFQLFFVIFEIYLNCLNEMINELKNEVKNNKRLFYKKYFQTIL